MKGLEEIKADCSKLYICDGNLTKAVQLFENSDDTGAWQVVLGNFDWLVQKGVLKEINREEVVSLANSVGKRYHKNNELSEEFSVSKKGEKVGNHIFYDENKKILKAKKYK